MKSENIIKVVEEGLKSKDQNLKRVRARATRSHFTIKDLKAKVANLEGRLDMMNGAYTALRAQNAEAIRERGNALYELTALKGELDLKARKAGTLPEDVESMRRALDTVRHDRDELDKTVTRLRDSIQFLQARNETLQEENSRLRQEIDECRVSGDTVAYRQELKKWKEDRDFWMRDSVRLSELLGLATDEVNRLAGRGVVR